MCKARKLFMLTLLCVFFIGGSTSVANGEEIVKGELGKKLDHYLTRITPFGFSGALLVAKDGEIVLNKGYGMANYEHSIPNSGKTIFRIGSVTKQFTAVAILQLVEKGKVSLKAHISEYLPYFREDIDPKITVHDLLVHSSGLPNYTDLPGFYAKHSRNPFKVKDFIIQ